MGTGIVICGLNGAGKSRLGKVLAERLHFHFIDAEDLYFPTAHIYADPRTHEDAEKILLNEIKKHQNFVFACVKGDHGEAVYPLFQYAVWMDVPQKIRMERVKDRSFQQFGNRMLPGGDLYEQEERFFALVRSRTEDTAKKWVRSLHCPIIRIDETKPVEENVNFIILQMRG